MAPTIRPICKKFIKSMMKFEGTKFTDVLVITPDLYRDDRGYFFESYNKKMFKQAGIENEFVQDNQSMSSYGVIRGLHGQKGQYSQAKLVRVLLGCVLDVIVDIRLDSPTYGQHISVELSDENNKQLFIPRGFLHGFSVLSKFAIFSYKCDSFYNKESEFGVIFNDPDLAIDWRIPVSKMIFSKKDMQHKRLKDVMDNR